MSKLPIFLTCCALLPLLTGGAANDPWSAGELVRPAELVIELRDQPTANGIWMVGPRILYNGHHIAGAEFVGPASSSEGITKLLSAAASKSHDAHIVIYCGCCPMEKCPNIRPAYLALKKAGFTHVRVLEIPTNLHTDWTQKGYLVEKGHVEK